MFHQQDFKSSDFQKLVTSLCSKEVGERTGNIASALHYRAYGVMRSLKSGSLKTELKTPDITLIFAVLLM